VRYGFPYFSMFEKCSLSNKNFNRQIVNFSPVVCLINNNYIATVQISISTENITHRVDLYQMLKPNSSLSKKDRSHSLCENVCLSAKSQQRDRASSSTKNGSKRCVLEYRLF